MIWGILALVVLLSLSVWVIIQQIKSIRDKKETIKRLGHTLDAERAELVRFRTALADVKIIEEKRREKNKEIDNTGNSGISGILNDLLRNP